MNKLFIALTYLLFSNIANAQMYKCLDGKGEVSYQQFPCQADEEVSWVKESPQEKRKKKRKEEMSEWKLIKMTDEMTDENICVLSSPHIFMGKKVKEFYLVSIRVTHEPGIGFLVGLRSEIAFEDYPPVFHNDTNDLGIRVDNNSFIRVDDKSQSRLLVFNHQKSKKIVEQFREGENVKLRVRFWPFDDRYDSGDQSLAKFNEGLEKLALCRAN